MRVENESRIFEILSQLNLTPRLKCKRASSVDISVCTGSSN